MIEIKRAEITNESIEKSMRVGHITDESMTKAFGLDWTNCCQLCGKKREGDE